MPRAYSLDLRERLLRAMAAGLSAAEIERTTGASTMYRWRRRVVRGDPLAPARPPGRVPLIGTDQWEVLRGQATAAPDATLDEH